jgi:hypothetical protein
MTCKRYGVALMLLAAGAAGCGSVSRQDTGEVNRGGYRALSASLVMPAPALRGDDQPGRWAGRRETQPWEYGRNDAALGVVTEPFGRQWAWAEVRTRDRRRTVNGRPREFSSTVVRTVRHRVTR